VFISAFEARSEGFSRLLREAGGRLTCPARPGTVFLSFPGGKNSWF